MLFWYYYLILNHYNMDYLSNFQFSMLHYEVSLKIHYHWLIPDACNGKWQLIFNFPMLYYHIPKNFAKQNILFYDFTYKFSKLCAAFLVVPLPHKSMDCAQHSLSSQSLSLLHFLVEAETLQMQHRCPMDQQQRITNKTAQEWPLVPCTSGLLNGALFQQPPLSVSHQSSGCQYLQ